jgi:hypothetical protein
MDRTTTLVALFALSVSGTSCGGPAGSAGENGTCFHADDCQAGLVCIERKCTSDLSSIDIAPPDAGTRAGGGPDSAGGTGGAGGSLPSDDAGGGTSGGPGAGGGGETTLDAAASGDL